jgi:hypothetical protein
MADSARTSQIDQARLISALQSAAVYPHSVSSFQVVETHISWVILTGQFAYKIKKAVNLGFLDFSTLERRRHFCEEELRLNARWAPRLYVGLVSINGSPDSPSIQDPENDSEAIEYAVKMLQFPQSAQLDRQLEEGLLREDDLLVLAETIANKHEQARVIEYANDRESVGKVRAPILGNFAPVERAIDMDLLERVRLWTEATLKALKPVLIQRRQEGFVRECHGDLHLSNLVRFDGDIVAFDCVEFSPDLRNIDVLSDIAFLVMDLIACARHDLAFAFLNRYLERTGDYAGMKVFGLYVVYHAMIRAKVAAIRATERRDEARREKDVDAVKHNLAVAARWIKTTKVMLIAMHGYSGSGKTWLSSQLLSRMRAIRLRSDIERKRLSGIAELADSNSKPGSGLYAPESNAAVYSHLLDAAGRLLDAGYNVIIDAAFLRRTDREALFSLAASRKVSPVFVSTSAAEAELEQRLKRRGQAGGEASEATVNVLRYQLETADPLADAEIPRVVYVCTEQNVDADELVSSINCLQ